MRLEFKDILLDAYDKNLEERQLITVNTKVSKEVFDKIVNLRFDLQGDYIPVQINGVEHVMRFGAIYYSEHEEYNKVQLTFVFKEYDEADPGTVNFVNNETKITLSKYVSELRVINEKLLNLLLEKGVLTEEEKKDIFNLTKKEVHLKSIELHKVKDIDDYTL